MNSVGVVSVEETANWLFDSHPALSYHILLLCGGCQTSPAPLQLATVAEMTGPVRYSPARLIGEGQS